VGQASFALASRILDPDQIFPAQSKILYPVHVFYCRTPLTRTKAALRQESCGAAFESRRYQSGLIATLPIYSAAFLWWYFRNSALNDKRFGKAAAPCVPD
jgi:hypothetical protein